MPATLRASRVVPVALCVLALAAVAIETPRHVSWYLAVDQFGYLSFARDLTAGRLFHAWPPIDGLRALLTMPMDVLVQTYIVDGARIYSRYSPGYPLLLAGAMTLFGTHGAIYLNVAILMGLLAVLFLLGRRLLGEPMAAAAAVGLVLVCPTLAALWARSPLRDLPAHLAALGGVALVLAAADAGTALRRWLLGGAALGYAMTIRPDAMLYLPSAALGAVVVWRGRGTPLARLRAAGGCTGRGARTRAVAAPRVQHGGRRQPVRPGAVRRGARLLRRCADTGPRGDVSGDVERAGLRRWPASRQPAVEPAGERRRAARRVRRRAARDRGRGRDRRPARGHAAGRRRRAVHGPRAAVLQAAGCTRTGATSSASCSAWRC